MSGKMKSIDGTLVTAFQDAENKFADNAVTNTDTAVVALTQSAEKAVKDFTAAQGETLAHASVNVKEGLAKAMKTSEEMVSFGQGNLEAAMKAAQIFATGLQDISKQVAASTQTSVEESVATMKAITGVKSVKEAIDLQTGFVRSMMEKAIAESSKLTDASLKLTEQAIAPITARVSLAVEKFSHAA